VASGADTPNGHSAASLRRVNSSIAQRIHSATLDVYALDSQLSRANDRLVALTRERGQIERERTSVRLRLDVTKQNARIANRRLGVIVTNLYEQQSSDPLAVFLGAQSLADAIATLDDLSRSAQTNREVAKTSLHASRSLTTLKRHLAHQDARVRALEADTARTTATLAASIGARNTLIAKLASQRTFNNRQIAKITAVAAAAATPRATAQFAAATSPPAVTPRAGSLTVTATGYSMPGTTATGLPVGWGTVAVDPSVIPLGTRMSIPGYGEGVAADTGSAVTGATIDLWFPTVQQAQAWGRRVVVVTLH
jgi:3D (Asp-Asp-Asp) domain-containing protein